MSVFKTFPESHQINPFQLLCFLAYFPNITIPYKYATLDLPYAQAKLTSMNVYFVFRAIMQDLKLATSIAEKATLAN